MTTYLAILVIDWEHPAGQGSIKDSEVITLGIKMATQGIWTVI